MQILSFNPSPRAGGDMNAPGLVQRMAPFQSTPPRGGRRCTIFTTCRCKKVSIHAPARGATLLRGDGEQGFAVSIHAPARGATLDRVAGPGCIGVSIHAPARGATLTLFVC